MPNNKIQDYIFYKIVCLDNSCNELCYVGSTANWKARNYSHKSNCTNENSNQYNQKKYQIIRENGGWSNFKMIEIGKREQLTKREAEQIEEEYREELRANMNSYRCYTTDEEKREYIKLRNKQYYQANPDKKAEKDKQYRLNNPDKIKQYNQQYRLNNPDKDKQYRLNNKEKFKQYREDNSDKIKEYKKEKITCECGCEIVRVTLSRHQKTKKHLKLMEVVQN